MKKRIRLFLLAFCLLLSACSTAAQTGPEPDPAPETVPSEDTSPQPPQDQEEPLSQREKDWREDIEFLREQYKDIHLRPFYFRTEEEFDGALDRLAARVEELTDSELYFELAAAVAGMGDTHTKVLEPEALYDRLLPFDTFYFGDRLYLVNYLEGHEELAPYLLREIVAVNGVDIAYLQRKAESITCPANSWFSKELFSYHWSFLPAFYEWASGWEEQETYTLQILNENQEVEQVEVPVISRAEYEGAEKIYPECLRSIPLLHKEDMAEYANWSGGCVFLAIGSMFTVEETRYQELFEKAARLLEEHPDCRKLAIDLRGNTGGYAAAFNYLKNDISILKDLAFEQVYVLTNGYTASYATRCLTLFEEELGAVKVGEPTGQFTSFFMHSTSANGVTVTLPHSQLSVLIATGWYGGDDPDNTAYNKLNKLYEWESTILPDVYVYQDIEDIRQGKDSVLEWVLAQK